MGLNDSEVNIFTFMFYFFILMSSVERCSDDTAEIKSNRKNSIGYIMRPFN